MPFLRGALETKRLLIKSFQSRILSMTLLQAEKESMTIGRPLVICTFARTLLKLSMKVLCSADEIGGIKEVLCGKGTDTSIKDARQPQSVKSIEEAQQSPKTKILQMVDYKSKYLIVCRLGGHLDIYDLNENYKKRKSIKVPVGQNEKLVSLVTVESLDLILVATEGSKVYIFPLNDIEKELEPVEVCLPGDKSISAFVSNPYETGVFAYGGQENDVRIVRLFEADKGPHLNYKTEPEVLFTARNVRNDYLDLRVPIWITGILFLQSKSKGYQFITTTRYGQMRLYDTVHGRRPILDRKLCDSPIISLNHGETEEEIIITDTRNLVCKYSLVRCLEKAFEDPTKSSSHTDKDSEPLTLGKYSAGANTGAIYGVDIVEDYIATGGLDRYLRIYNLEDRDLLAKVYLGTQVTSVVILEGESDADGVSNSAQPVEIKKRRRKIHSDQPQNSDESDDELWKQLDENRQSKEKKRTNIKQKN